MCMIVAFAFLFGETADTLEQKLSLLPVAASISSITACAPANDGDTSCGLTDVLLLQQLVHLEAHNYKVTHLTTVAGYRLRVLS